MGVTGVRYRCSVVVDGEVLWKRSFWVLRDAERWASKRLGLVLLGDEPGYISISDHEGEIVRWASEILQ